VCGTRRGDAGFKPIICGINNMNSSEVVSGEPGENTRSSCACLNWDYGDCVALGAEGSCIRGHREAMQQEFLLVGREFTNEEWFFDQKDRAFCCKGGMM